ncbi:MULTISPECIES: class I mannose-6-phosphate isomerase [unclassified Sphingopyxis]|jgi:mannose-6-phosphate isomerase|uniref:class I mannose-6-phosphate isomerase n=1 Tax=unclassified Sphingopyxis TaxID=2614943 RepID=UPI00285D6B9D|nr:MULTISPECIES: class I mannose-6-phosphate isomerase [unclassified Sphingopyxis]MDR6832050.1 mannose-6-phosphate isomerase [Sphingopyxis sp. BE122]MDR7227792.1 mannose-6-phosphate isomerase [Sphingopyxis sp. BE259]
MASLPRPRHNAGNVRRLPRLVVEKPWGRDDIPREYGDFQGRRIGEIWFAHPGGDAAPLMVKFLFTSERLSVQVHPDDIAAKAAGLARGKDECWLVLAADADAELGAGLTVEVDRDALRAAALDGSIVDLIDWRAAAKDDFVYNPAGTIHAIGAGLTIVEVQQNIDRTYRLYDYGRPRDLHLDEGLAVARLDPVADPRDRRVDPAADARLVSGPHFHVLHLTGSVNQEAIADARGELTFVPLSPGCRAAGETVSLGEAVLIDDASLVEIAPGARALLCWAA